MKNVTSVYIVEKIKHLDAYPVSHGKVVALSIEEVEFIKGQWDDSDWGQYCNVTEVKRDLRFVCRDNILRRGGD